MPLLRGPNPSWHAPNRLWNKVMDRTAKGTLRVGLRRHRVSLVLCLIAKESGLTPHFVLSLEWSEPAPTRPDWRFDY